MSNEMSDIAEFFVEDATEHLHQINDDLLALEQHQEDRSLVDKIFRAVHAIKGSAGMAGFFVSSQLAHKVEDLLSQLREQQIALSGALFDLLFQSADILTSQINNIANGQKEEESALASFEELYEEFARQDSPAQAQTAPRVLPPKKATKIPSPPPEGGELALAERYIQHDQFDRAIDMYLAILRKTPSNKAILQMLEETKALQAYFQEISVAR
jgi:two-component system chemotaxis sensor kinase CheA